MGLLWKGLYRRASNSRTSVRIYTHIKKIRLTCVVTVFYKSFHYRFHTRSNIVKEITCVLFEVTGSDFQTNKIGMLNTNEENP